MQQKMSVQFGSKHAEAVRKLEEQVALANKACSDSKGNVHSKKNAAKEALAAYEKVFTPHLPSGGDA